MTNPRKIKFGTSGPEVFPMALGCMSMGAGSWYGARDDAEGIATIHAALDRGVNVLDTGDFYGMGKNELLVGQALRGRRDQAILSVKYGAQRGPDGAIAWVRARAAAQRVTIVPTLGARTPKQLADAVAALDVSLSPADVGALEAAVPASEVAGARYPAPMLQGLDSER